MHDQQKTTLVNGVAPDGGAAAACPECATLEGDRYVLRAALEHLVQAYSNRHSPQHRTAALREAAGVLSQIRWQALCFDAPIRAVATPSDSHNASDPKV